MHVPVTDVGGYIGTVPISMMPAEGCAVRAVDRFFFGRDLLADHDGLDAVVEDCRKLTLPVSKTWTR